MASVGVAFTPDLAEQTRARLEALGEASRKWFEALRPVYDDLIYYLELAPEDETAREIRKKWQVSVQAPDVVFAREIKARWQQRLDECRAGRAPWPRFRLG